MGETKQPALEQGGLRTDQLQFLRFLAFLNVYIAHAEQWIFFPYPAHHCATAAVSFFFVLSGLLTGYNAHGKQVRLSVGEEGRYMWKKLCKVYPLYLLTTLYPLLTSDMTEWIVAGNYAALLPELKQLGKNLLFLQSWFTEGYFSFNGPSWFLATMMFLYLFNLPAIWLLNKVGKRRWHIPVLVCAMGGVWAMLIVYCYSTQNWDVAYWHYIFPPARMGEYFVGMIFGYLLRELGPKLRMDGKKWKKLVFTLLEIAVLLYWFRCLSRLGNFWRNHSERWMVPNLLLLGVFTLGGGWISDLFRRRPLVRLGDVAFECFLIHNLFILQYGYRHSVPEDAFAGKAYSFLLCLVLTIGASLLVGGGKPSGGRSKNQK